MFKGLLAILFLLSFPLYSMDQNYYIAVEPQPFFQGGFEAQAGARFGHLRLNFGINETEKPAYIKEGNAISAESRSIIGSLSFGPSDGKGPFGGVEFRSARHLLQHTTTKVKRRRDNDYLGVRLGYNQYFREHFFVRPILSVLKNLESKTPIILSGESSEVRENVFFLSVLFGAYF